MPPLKSLLERSASLRPVALNPASVALPVFTATIGLSAFLLFAVQPMFTKMVVPTLGGTPAVWSVAIVFFQAILLAGYAYAHLLIRHLALQTAILVHLCLAALVLGIGLPIAFDASWGRPSDSGQALWLISVFTACVGLPFFAVSANGPLLQAWYAATGRPDAHDPYFLYRASNLGSFLALLAYPFFFEPSFTLRGQSAAWSIGFGLLAAGLAACGWIVLGGNQAQKAKTESSVSHPTSTPDKLTWIALGFVPSALLVAVTSHITTDVASVPLLWIVPLALYLLSFVVAFDAQKGRLVSALIAAQPLIAAMLVLGWLVHSYWLLALHLAFFFVSATVCHARLYQMRPPAHNLSAFYLCLSFGGVLGGGFTTLLAPAIFNTVLEYPLLIAAALCCRPGLFQDVRSYGPGKVALFFALSVGALAVAYATSVFIHLPVWTVLACLGVLAAVMGMSRERPARLVAAAGLGLAIILLIQGGRDVIERARSFFGVHTVAVSPDGRVHKLVHGNTVHGVERFRDDAHQPLTNRPEPAAYFQPNGVYAQAVGALRAAQGGKFGRAAVIGLGMGALACHAQPGEDWTFFEIDPVIVKIARDTRLFRSLSVCAPQAAIVSGDGRLTLAEASGTFDLIVIDAFSSDSVPVHLLTREALALYAAKLSPHGAIIFNISNRYMILGPTVAMSAAANGLITREAADRIKDDRETALVAAAQVAVVARTPDQLGALIASPNWRAPVPAAGEATWTDDYSNILAPLMRKLRPR
jgi:hypothetical protein